ncbi:MAG TPA: signal recognition particle protein [Alphaproteobacteria bacterium]|nr:signal recognition particle protein [Alphaproteobacteria bacterium]
MFENLGQKLNTVFARLQGRGTLNEAEVDAALRDIRVALLEADVALEVVKDFTAKLRLRALEEKIIASVTPGQQVVKLVQDALVEELGREAAQLNLQSAPPVSILMLGLQGSGKTTSSAKLAKRLAEAERKKVLLASLDVNRPAAQEQLAVLAAQIGVESLPIVAGQKPLQIAKRALDEARRGGFDVLILDSAGRLAVDEELMQEAKALKLEAAPAETLLVLDAMTGQDAITTARRFHGEVGLTGLILTRLDGDARGGAALSLRAVTGQPILFFGSGEKLDAFEVYHPQRIVSRLLDMGDVAGLVEKAVAEIDQKEAAKLAAKMQKGGFDFDDLSSQLKQMQRMGGLSGIAALLPGAGKLKEAMAQANVDEKIIARQQAIISSMTRAERKNVDLLNASRKRRIAAGAGADVPAVNRLIKQYLHMRDMMKQMKKKGFGGKGMQGLDMSQLRGMVPPNFRG